MPNSRRIAGHDQLRTAGAATRGGCLPRRRDDVGQVARIGPRRPEAERDTTAPGERRVVEGWVDTDHGGGVGQLHDRVELALWQPPRDRLRRGPKPPGRHVGDEPVDAVRHCDGDHVTLPHPVLVEVHRQVVTALHQLGAGDGVVAAGDGRPIGLRLGQLAETTTERDDGHCRTLRRLALARGSGLRDQLRAAGIQPEA